MLVVKEIGVVEVRFFDLRRSALGDGEEFVDARFSLAGFQALITLAKGFGDGASHGFAGFFGDCLSEAMGFGVFDVQHDLPFLP